jgi:hypothetical protein
MIHEDVSIRLRSGIACSHSIQNPYANLVYPTNKQHRLREQNRTFGLERKQQVDANACTVIISIIFIHSCNIIRVKKSRMIRWTGHVWTYELRFTSVLLGCSHKPMKRENTEDISVDGRKVVRLVFNRWWYEADSSGSGQGPVTCACEAPCNESLNSTKCKEYHDYSKNS